MKRVPPSLGKWKNVNGATHVYICMHNNNEYIHVLYYIQLNSLKY